VRIDRFLHCIRLVKSRTLAQALIDTGHVRVDGSIVALPLRGEVRILKVLSLPGRRGPASEARACYEELGVDEPSPAT
jgi:ribosome-associated heat shock protein Hsp15